VRVAGANLTQVRAELAVLGHRAGLGAGARLSAAAAIHGASRPCFEEADGAINRAREVCVAAGGFDGVAAGLAAEVGLAVDRAGLGLSAWPHERLQSDSISQSPSMQSIGQWSVLHEAVSRVTAQWTPPYWGWVVMLRERVWVPLPQVTEQAPNAMWCHGSTTQ